jgi:acyl carrier protein
MKNNSKKTKKLLQIFKIVFKLKNLKQKDLTRNKIKSWDSINQMNLISAIEDEFNFRFKDKELEKLDSFKNIINLIPLQRY